MAPARKRADVERDRGRGPFYHRPPDAGPNRSRPRRRWIPPTSPGRGTDGEVGREEGGGGCGGAKRGAAVAAATGRPRGEADAEMKEGERGAGGEGAGKER